MDHNPGVITTTPAGATFALAITAIETTDDILAAQGIAYSVFDGNAYAPEPIFSNPVGTDTITIQISGAHTIQAATAAGYVLIAVCQLVARLTVHRAGR